MSTHSERSVDREWFVYCDLNYYPYGEVVTAATAEEAIQRVAGRDASYGAVAFPLDQVAAVAEDNYPEPFLDRLRREGADR